MGSEFWGEMRKFMDAMAAAGTISPEDLELFLWTDSVDEAVAHLQEHAVKQFGLRLARGEPKSMPILGEHELSAA